MRRWDVRFSRLAEEVASWSKDPSTKVGCVLVKDRKIVATGYNGFPAGIADDARLLHREEKYPRVVHAEANAIIQAGHAARGSTAYTVPLPPCAECAKLLITAGVVRVVVPAAVPADRWRENCEVALDLFREAGVEVDRV